jgi:hypothetical protein
MAYTLDSDGDSFEKKYWNLFLKASFPSYEKYWSAKITPLTQRPRNIHFMNSNDLTVAGYNGEDVCQAQLHYTVLRQLVGAYEILVQLRNKKQEFRDSDVMAEGLFHIGAAQDVAFEFLQRIKTPNIYDPWTANKRLSQTGATLGSQEACKKWKDDNRHPLSHIRKYRNHLSHGRMLPAITNVLNNKLYLPKIGAELKYLDWRIIINPQQLVRVPTDFDNVDNILDQALQETMKYLETEWQKL